MRRWFIYCKMLRNEPAYELHEDGRTFVMTDPETREWREQERVSPDDVRLRIEAMLRGSMYAVVETTDPDARPVWPEPEPRGEPPPTAFPDITPDSFFAAVPMPGFKMPKKADDAEE